MPLVSVIIPTLREAQSLPALVPRIAAALAGREFEILIIDDNSRDGTAEVCATLTRDFPVGLIVRDHPADGLGGAVLTGLRAARGEQLLVMDADLQHPPERIPDLLRELDAGAEFVLGSRHVAGASTAEQWSLARRINSRIATLLARPFAGAVRDPMSGFFALPRDVFARSRFLAPLGYKIGLELMCKSRARRVIEVPIHFDTRKHGASKLTLKEQFRYLEHLSRLYDFTFPRLAPAVKFCITVALAWLVHIAVFGLARVARFSLPVAATLGYVGAILSSAVFHLRYVRTQRQFLPRPSAWRDYWVSGVVELLACAATASYLGARLDGPSSFELMTIPFGVATVLRYVLRKELLLDIRGLRFTAAGSRTDRGAPSAVMGDGPIALIEADS